MIYILCLTLVAAGVIAVLLLAILRYVRRLARTQIGAWALQASLTLQEQERQGREYLGSLLQMNSAELPPSGGWAASADFLIILAEQILMNKPSRVVEFGSGVSTLVALRCLEINGSGELISYDHDATFAKVSAGRAKRMGFDHQVKVANLTSVAGYKGRWYEIEPPSNIDILVVDGPPAAIHPETRGGAGSLFRQLSPNGVILLDDANRGGEMMVVEQWKRENPGMSFLHIDTTKGTTLGRCAPSAPTAQI